MGPGPISGDREPPLRKMPSALGAPGPGGCLVDAPTGIDIMEVGVTVDNDLLREFEELLEQHFEQNPELATSLWRDIEEDFTRKIIELERRKERLKKLRNKVRAIRMLYEATPKPPGQARSNPDLTGAPRLR
jgi:hypothetical protein